MTKQLMLINGTYLKYFNEYSNCHWNEMIKEFINKRYFFDLKKDITKNFTFFSLIEYYTKLNPVFLNRFIKVLKEELGELQNDYLILDLIIDSYEFTEKLNVGNLIRDYFTFQIIKGINYNKLLEVVKIIIKSDLKYAKPTSFPNEITEIVCDNFIFYFSNQTLNVNIPYVFEILSEFIKDNY